VSDCQQTAVDQIGPKRKSNPNKLKSGSANPTDSDLWKSDGIGFEIRHIPRTKRKWHNTEWQCSPESDQYYLVCQELHRRLRVIYAQTLISSTHQMLLLQWHYPKNRKSASLLKYIHCVFGAPKNWPTHHNYANIQNPLCSLCSPLPAYHSYQVS